MSQNESYHVNESLRNDLRLRKFLRSFRNLQADIFTQMNFH